MPTRRTALLIAFALTLGACGSGTDQAEVASCRLLSQADIDKAVSGWTGDGQLTVIEARKAPSDGGSMFTEAWFIKGSAPGMEEVFVFANDPGGLFMGADGMTREFFDWGAAADRSSPIANDARATINAAPKCVS